MSVSIKTVVTNALNMNAKSGAKMLEAVVLTIAHGQAHNCYAQFARLAKGYSETAGQRKDFETVQRAIVSGKFDETMDVFKVKRGAVALDLSELEVHGSNDCNTIPKLAAALRGPVKEKTPKTAEEVAVRAILMELDAGGDVDAMLERAKIVAFEKAAAKAAKLAA